MKKILFLLLALLLLLCGCARASNSAPAAAPPLPSAEASAAPAEDEALSLLLDSLRDSVQPGTAGASLKAASVAAALLDWGLESRDEAALGLSVRRWRSAQSAEALERLPEQLASLEGMLEWLVSDYEASAGLLDDAGLTGRGPWTEAAAAQVRALLAALGG